MACYSYFRSPFRCPGIMVVWTERTDKVHGGVYGEIRDALHLNYIWMATCHGKLCSARP